MSGPSQTPGGTLGWICTANPFYVVSAGLFLAGLWLSFGDPMLIENTWAMIAGLGAYTLLLAGTAFILVRWMKLWDDARTVLLLLVLMFLATSVTFDEALVVDTVDPQGNGIPVRGIICYVAGFLFAVAVSAGLLRGIGLKLPAGYRLPYYLMLALFFGYPVAISRYLSEPNGDALRWGMFGFSSVAGLVFLTLLPAIRRGASYVENNGSPWPWPLYPWSLFVFLAVAVIGRAVLLCWSMHPIGGAHPWWLIFGPYFLVPFGLALTVLVLEMGIVSGHRGLLGTAMTAPIGLITLALVGHRDEPLYTEFLNLFTTRIGADPVFCTMIAVAAFYGYALIRRVAWSVEALTATLAALAFVHPDILNDQTPGNQPAPLILAATLLLGLGIVYRQSWRCLLGGLGLVAGFAMGIPVAVEFIPYRLPIAFHLVVLVLFIIGAAFEDELARFARFMGGFLMLLACLGVIFVRLAAPVDMPTWWLDAYPPTVAALLAVYGWWRWHTPTLAVAGLVFIFWALVSGWHVYRACRQFVVGLDYLAMSLVVFIVAISISLGKAGILSRWLTALREED